MQLSAHFVSVLGVCMYMFHRVYVLGVAASHVPEWKLPFERFWSSIIFHLPNLLAHPFLYLPVCHFIISVTFSDAFKQICYNSVTPSIITMINPFSYAISHGISILVYWMVLSGYQIDDNIDRQQCTLYMNA